MDTLIAFSLDYKKLLHYYNVSISLHSHFSSITDIKLVLYMYFYTDSSLHTILKYCTTKLPEFWVLLVIQQMSILFSGFNRVDILKGITLIFKTSLKKKSKNFPTQQLFEGFFHTCICRTQMVWVTSKECLVVLGREIHVIISQRLSSCHPSIPVKEK